MDKYFSNGHAYQSQVGGHFPDLYSHANVDVGRRNKQLEQDDFQREVQSEGSNLTEFAMGLHDYSLLGKEYEDDGKEARRRIQRGTIGLEPLTHRQLPSPISSTNRVQGNANRNDSKGFPKNHPISPCRTYLLCRKTTRRALSSLTRLMPSIPGPPIMTRLPSSSVMRRR